MEINILSKQIDRLKTRFGEKAFDDEFIRLVIREVSTMSEGAFINFVDVMIGSRPYNRPPLLSEFREARLAEEQQRLKATSQRASQTFQQAQGKTLDLVLARDFPGCKTVGEAIKKARQKINSVNQPAKADEEE